MQIYKNKRVFLTGHTGFKGSWLSLWLESLGAEVFGYALEPSTNPSHYKLLGGGGNSGGSSKSGESGDGSGGKNSESKGGANGVLADIRDRFALFKALCDFEPDIIFHLAAQPLVRESYKNPLETFETNALGTLNLLDAARALKNCRAIVVITTDKVYENREWVWGYREIDALGGHDPYSASKACAEIVTSSMRRSFFNPRDFGRTHATLIATARAGNVIGGGDFSADRLLPDLARAAMAGARARIRNPHSTRPWQSVLEPLRGYLMLGARLLNGEVDFADSFNFGPTPEGNLSVLEMLEIARSHFGAIRYEIIEEAGAPHEANLLMLDTQKAAQMLGYTPLLSTRESIEWTMAWYRAFIESGEILSYAQLENYQERVAQAFSSAAADNAIAGGGGSEKLRQPHRESTQRISAANPRNPNSKSSQRIVTANLTAKSTWGGGATPKS